MTRSFIPLLLLLLFMSSSAQSQRAPVELVSFRERMVDHVPIAGGGIRVGVVATGSIASFEPRRFYVHIPAGARGPLCVSIVSQDGRYQADVEYRLDNPPPGATALPLPTEYSSDLRGYHARHLAILAHLSADCGGAMDRFLVAGWTAAGHPGEMTVLINSSEPARVLEPGVAGAQAVECVEVRGVAAVAFNRSCAVNAAVRSGRVELVLQRARRSVPPVRLPVVLP